MILERNELTPKDKSWFNKNGVIYIETDHVVPIAVESATTDKDIAKLIIDAAMDTALLHASSSPSDIIYRVHHRLRKKGLYDRN